MDLHAAQNTTSVYTGVVTFPLFPAEVSNDLTSLLEDRDRLAVIIDLTVGADGRVGAVHIDRGLACNRAKLNYDEVGAWLENIAPIPASVSRLDSLAEQLRTQQVQHFLDAHSIGELHDEQSFGFLGFSENHAFNVTVTRWRRNRTGSSVPKCLGFESESAATVEPATSGPPAAGIASVSSFSLGAGMEKHRPGRKGLLW
ncbi:MAG: exoribonuclease [Chthoniobacter sp.]|jgi:exoribonuclease II|nr:exoribonuclease [Chthoniobacter sp.]